VTGIVRRVKVAAGARDDSRGQLLIEVLIALALLGIISTVFIGAMYTALHSARIADERSIALTLAKSEIEYVKQQVYSTNEWGYSVDSSTSTVVGSAPDFPLPPPLSGADFVGYSVLVTGTNVDLDSDGTDDAGIREITATVLHHGAQVLTLQNFELDR
jgi:type II secretory pathway pseudopilin PulG